MKKIQLFALLLMVMCAVSCEKDNSPIIQFKDPKFLEALLFQVDMNGDGQISEKEASLCLSLHVSEYDITNLEEIKYFTSLTKLQCSWNQLTSLDLSNNTALTELSCIDNQLTSLDLSNNTALTSLSCIDNQLTSLDLSNCAALESLFCYENQLTSLDLSNNTALTYLHCWGNQLTSLDVSNNTALTSLACSDNQLTSLDVSNNTALTSLSCGGNQLTSLDLSNNRWLEYFSPINYTTAYNYESGEESYEYHFDTACPLESLIIYKYHVLSDQSLRVLEEAYPDLKITYVE